MSAIDHLCGDPGSRARIAPLFWIRDEEPAVIREEILRMADCGLDGLIVESRPHADFLGDRWWRDLDVIIDTAAQRGMRVWVFDDRSFPTGDANGAVVDHPEAGKRFLRTQCIEAPGPLVDARFQIAAWLADDERLLGVCAAPLLDADGTTLDGERLVDLSHAVVDGILRWSIPAGRWRLMLLFESSRGGEAWTSQAINPVDPAGVQLLLDTVYEPHRQRYGEQFGGTFAGFFTDEPRFGSASGYAIALGDHQQALPFSGLVEEVLRHRWGAAFVAHCCALWWPLGEQVHASRFCYMDVITRAWQQSWSRIGDWCRKQGLSWIGHVVEDNGAHARLGYGAGHFFRGLANMSAGGMDVVYQIWPDMRDGHFVTPFGELDARFFYWGLSRLASSASHIDPARGGICMAECFGAYGWQFGLRRMIWLTHHLLVRGVNQLVPHAWSMRYPDADCPPHFHARGHNPQSPLFPDWVAYAQRLCRLLEPGQHRCDAAICYHAEAEWAGSYQPFEDCSRALARHQLDGDILPVDLLIDDQRARLIGGRLAIDGGEAYPCLILPYAQRWPLALLERCHTWAAAGLPIFIIRALPSAASDGDGSAAIDGLVDHAQIIAHEDDLARTLRRRGLCEVCALEETASEWIRVYRMQRDSRHLLFVVNENPQAGDSICLQVPGSWPDIQALDPWSQQALALSRRRQDGRQLVDLVFSPGEALLLIAGDDDALSDLPCRIEVGASIDDATCTLQLCGYRPTASDAWQQVSAAIGDTQAIEPLRGRSGQLRYSGSIVSDTSEPPFIDLGAVGESAEVTLNSEDLGRRLHPPYRFDCAAAWRAGANEIEIVITTTLAPSDGDNCFDRAWPQEPTGLLGPVQILSAAARAPLGGR